MRGIHKPGTCDRCGWRYPLATLKHEYRNERMTGLKVCETCWDPDHPQEYQLPKIRPDDPRPLRDPRPEIYDASLNDTITWDLGDGLLWDDGDGMLWDYKPWLT